MPKYYVKSGKITQVIDSKTPYNAAVKVFMREKRNLLTFVGDNIKVSEVGFKKHFDDFNIPSELVLYEVGVLDSDSDFNV